MAIGKSDSIHYQNIADSIRRNLSGAEGGDAVYFPAEMAGGVNAVAEHNYQKGYTDGGGGAVSNGERFIKTVYGTEKNVSVNEAVDQAISDFNAIKLELGNRGAVVSDIEPTENYSEKIGIVYEKGAESGFASGKDVGIAEGFESGKQAGIIEGYNTGKTEGYNSGYQIGKVDGTAEGYGNGYNTGKSEGYNEGYSIGKVDRENELKGDFYGIFETVGVELPCNPTINDSFGEIREGIDDALERKDKGVELYWTDKDGSIGSAVIYEHPFVKTIKAPASVIIGDEALTGSCYRIELLGDVEINYLWSGKVLELYNKLGTLSKEQLESEYGVYVTNLYSDASGESKISQDEQGFVWFVDDDVVYLCDYRGKSKDIILPQSYNGREYTFWEKALAGLRINYIHIPKEIKSFTGTIFKQNPFNNDIDIDIDDPDDWCEKSFSELYSNPMSLGARLTCNGEIIKSITIPEEILKVGKVQFYNNKDIETVILHDKITEISESAFRNCSNIKSITIPDGVTTISNYAFSYSGLESFVFPKNIATLGTYMFQYCNSLKIITINGTTLSRYMCAYCKALTDIIINDNITTVDTYSFSGCDSITNVTVNGTIKLSNNNLSFSASSLLTVESMVSIMNSLVSLVGSTQRTVYFGSTNLAKLTAEQKAIATNKNIKLA